MTASLALIGALDDQTTECERELRALRADHRYVPPLTNSSTPRGTGLNPPAVKPRTPMDRNGRPGRKGIEGI